jgi:hypothetical protein
MGYKRTGGKNGAPLGNQNRLTHGRYARSTMARRKEGFGALKDTLLLHSMAVVAARILEAERDGRRVPKEILDLIMGGAPAKPLD